jgi:hypothetical protein
MEKRNMEASLGGVLRQWPGRGFRHRFYGDRVRGANAAQPLDGQGLDAFGDRLECAGGCWFTSSAAKRANGRAVAVDCTVVADGLSRASRRSDAALSFLNAHKT